VIAIRMLYLKMFVIACGSVKDGTCHGWCPEEVLFALSIKRRMELDQAETIQKFIHSKPQERHGQKHRGRGCKNAKSQEMNE
jgi:hypothetical protein